MSAKRNAFDNSPRSFCPNPPSPQVGHAERGKNHFYAKKLWFYAYFLQNNAYFCTIIRIIMQ